MFSKTVTHRSLTIIIRTTPCIVTSPPSISAFKNILVVPANSQLIGTKFPYFPHPEFNENNPSKLPNDVPPSKWGSVSLGSGQFYPVQCIDGILQLEAPNIRKITAELEDVEVGQAILTSCQATQNLLPHYDAICHVVPPLWKTSSDTQSLQLLQKAYDSVLDTSLNLNFNLDTTVVSMPLLGCGARGAPTTASIFAATTAITSYQGNGGTLEFCLQREDLAEKLFDSLSINES